MIHDADDITCGEQDEAPQRIRPDEYTPQAAAGANPCPACGGDPYYCEHTCRTCGRPLVRLTVRWLDTDTLSDYCQQSPTLFHTPGEEG